MTDMIARSTAGRREWLALAVLCLPTMLTMLDISVLFLAVPQITVDLGAGATEQLWITDIYGFLIAGFLITMGSVGDRIGRRRLLLLGATAFGALSALAAYAPSTEVLIAARALLGVAGATIMPSTLALIIGMFRDPRQLGVAISVWASALTAGVALGPLVGGALLQAFWWGAAFLVAVPVMLLLVVTGPRLLPESRDPGAPGVDPVSVVLSLVAVLPLVYGLKELAQSGWSPGPVALTLAGALAGVVFVVRQGRLAHPMLDLGLFRIVEVRGALLISLLVGALQSGSGFFVAQYLLSVEGLSPLAAGLWMLVPTFGLVIGIFVSQGIAQRVRPAHVVAAGAAIASAGMVVLTQVTPGGGPAILLLGFTVVYVGVSPVGPLAGRLVVPAAPPERAGSASAMQSMSGELGVALGIAVLGSLGAAIYTSAVEVPPALANTAPGRAAAETMAEAVAVAQRQPTGIGDALISSARDAFASGLNVTAAVCALAFAGIAVLALTTLRRIPPFGPPAAQ
ncbi:MULTISPECIES: MFS transporter [Nonomuraea]|uniref:MFS transporter n=1 Tax=Nonomuraea ferruginea TaxID=46174 RepID=A0ABT4SZA2_9ACTN|nr:MFS transporter [Nonomuraea ferruginea]MDA0642582.1 MFS transporter [Nonomuraea ferruginea]